MAEPQVRIYFDFVDPLSYVVSRLLEPLRGGPKGARVEWVGFELRLPPEPLTTADDPIWTRRREAARTRADELGLVLDPPTLVPWTRKAHELHTLAAEQGKADAVRAAVFDAYFAAGRDIGRVDVLVEIGTAAGLDRTETKAVLDVDRHEADVASARRSALGAGVSNVPSIFVDGPLPEDFPDPRDLGTLLPDV